MGIKNKKSRHNIGDVVMFPMQGDKKKNYSSGIIIDMQRSKDGNKYFFLVKWVEGDVNWYDDNGIHVLKTHFQSASKGY